MARPKKAVPSMLRHKSSGQARVQINGRDIYLGRWGSKEANQAYARICAEYEAVGGDVVQAAQHAAEAGVITLAEMLLLFLDFAEAFYQKNGKPTSHVSGFKTPIKVMRELYGSLPADKFGPLKLEVVRSRFVAQGVSRPVANRYCKNVCRIFKWAAGQELVTASVHEQLTALGPLQQGRTKAREPKPVSPVTDAVVDATLPHLTPLVADMVRLQRLTGMRPDEVCSLRPGDIDRSAGVWEFRPPSHKLLHKEINRVIYIGPRGQKLLEPYLRRPENEFCFSAAEAAEQVKAERQEKRKTPPTHGNYRGSKPGKKKPVRSPGARYSTAAYRRAISRACEKAFNMPAKLTREQANEWRAIHCWSPNRLRHAFATQARKAGGLEAAQALLGHSELKTTQLYAEKQAELAAEIALRIG